MHIYYPYDTFTTPFNKIVTIYITYRTCFYTLLHTFTILLYIQEIKRINSEDKSRFVKELPCLNSR